MQLSGLYRSKSWSRGGKGSSAFSGPKYTLFAIKKSTFFRRIYIYKKNTYIATMENEYFNDFLAFESV